MGKSTWRRFLAAGLAGVVVCALLRGDVQAGFGTALRLAAVVAMVVGIRAWRPPHALAWYCLATGGAAVVLGHVVLAVWAGVTGEVNPFPSPADVFYVFGYLAVIAGEVLLVRRRSADIEGDNLIDSLIVVTCIGVVVWAYVLMGYAKDPSLGLGEKALSGAYSLLTLAVVGVAARLAVGSGRRNPSYYLLAGSFAFLLTSDVLTTLETAAGTRSSLPLLTSVVTYVLLASAILHPSMTRLTDRPADREIQLTRRRLVLLFAALLFVPGLLVVNAFGDNGANVSVMAAGSVALSVLVLGRLVGLVRAKDRKAERERILREAGEALVASTTREQTYDAALAALLALVADDQDGRVSVMVGPIHDLRVVATAGDGADQALSMRADISALPAEARRRLDRLEPALVERGRPVDVDLGDDGVDDRSVLVVPLSSKKQVRGAVALTTDRVLGPDTVRTVEAIANQVSLALESAALTEEIHQRRHERRFRALVENSSDLVSVIGPDGTLSFVSPASMRLLGTPESDMLGEHPFARMHPEDRYQASALLDRAWAVPGLREPIEARLRHGNGEWRWFEIVADDLLDEPEVAGMVIHARDITDRKEAQLRVEESEARFRSLVQHASDVVIVLRDDLTMSYVSPSVSRVLGHLQEDLTGESLSDLVHPDDAMKARGLTGAMPAKHVELRVRHRDGSWLTLDLTVSDLRHDRAVGGIVLNGRDVTERRDLQRQLEHQALYDDLTGLANRSLFKDRVGRALASRNGAKPGLAVLFIDLDDFKTVNDGLGHAAGDTLLIEVASRIGAALRGEDTAARLGGDEFAVLIESPPGEAGTLEIVERVQAALRTEFVIDGRGIHVTASIGIALEYGEPTTPDVLLRNADVAMYQAKSKGKNRYQLFEAGMHALVKQRFELKGDLRSGLDRDEFRPLYQPIVDLFTGEVTGAEALLRWHHPRLGVLPPASFIPLAEETGFIVPMGRRVLEQACAQLRRWMDRHPERKLGVSVNVSAVELERPDFPDHVHQALDHFALPPSALCLEITESVLMADVDSACRRLSELKALDVVLAVDDFGAPGFSSWSDLLQRLPVDVLKIDRSFIQPLGRRPLQTDSVRAVIDLARSYGLLTVAEGIEEAHQVPLLQALGCREGQGFHFSKPVTAEAFDGLLARHGHPALQ